jgi:hypothetical protein
MKKKISKSTSLLLYGIKIPLLKGCDQSSSDSEGEKSQPTDISGSLEMDESHIFNSINFKSIASQRVQ